MNKCTTKKENEVVGYIYKTTNLINGKIYVGLHQNTEFNENYFGSGKLLKKAVKKYGLTNFECEVIEWCETKEKLAQREVHWISKLEAKVKGTGYNLHEGGGMPPSQKGTTLSNETRKRISEGLKGKYGGVKAPWYGIKGKNNPNFGIKRTEEEKEKISRTKKGKYKGEKSYWYGKKGKEHCAYGHRHTEEHKKMMSKMMSGENGPGYGKRGALNGNSVKIINLDTLEVFESLADACDKYKLVKTNLSKTLKGKRRKWAGYRWAYYEEYLKSNQ